MRKFGIKRLTFEKSNQGKKSNSEGAKIAMNVERLVKCNFCQQVNSDNSENVRDFIQDKMKQCAIAG